MEKTIHIIQGEKGGVGKSVVSLALAYTFAVRGEPIVVIETDRSNGDVGRACEGKDGYTVITPYLSENPAEIGKADELLESVLNLGMNAVMNAPAQSHRATLQWLAQGSADLAIEEGITFRIWFVTSGEYDSVALFLQSVNDFPFPHVLVRNLHFIKQITYDYSNRTANSVLAEAIAQHDVPVIDFPAFIPSDIDLVRSHALTFSEAVSSTELKLAERSRIRRAVRTFTDAIEEVLGYGSIAPAPHGDDATGTESGDIEPTPARSKRSRKAKGVGDSPANGD